IMLAMLVTAIGVLSVACGLGGAVPPPQAPAPAHAPPVPSAAAPPPAATAPTEPPEAFCFDLITPTGDGVGRIMLNDAGPASLDVFVKTVNDWFACAPRYRRADPLRRNQAMDTLRQWGSQIEEWYLAHPALRSAELVGVPLPVAGD